MKLTYAIKFVAHPVIEVFKRDVSRLRKSSRDYNTISSRPMITWPE